MKRLARVLKSLSFIKGPFFTAVGVTLIGVSIWLMIEEKAITDTGVELLVAGLILSGVNEETISHIRNKPNDPK